MVIQGTYLINNHTGIKSLSGEFFDRKVKALSSFWLILTIGVMMPIMWRSVEWYLDRRGVESWEPPKGLLFHTYVGVMMVLCAAGAYGHFARRGQERTGTLVFTAIVFVALCWHGWHKGVIERREKLRQPTSK